MLRSAAVLVVVLAFGCSSAPTGEEQQEGRQVQSIVRTTNSPFCPGKTLDSCPSPRAGEWRRDIRTWVEDGVPANEIRDRLQARVPDFDLGIAPVKSGWVIPVIALLLSTLWLIIVGRSLSGPTPPAPSRRPPEDADLDVRLDEELAQLD